MVHDEKGLKRGKKGRLLNRRIVISIITLDIFTTRKEFSRDEERKKEISF